MTQNQFNEFLFHTACHMVRKTPRRAYPLALCFYFMNHNEQALQLARQASGLEADSLCLELLLLCRRYVECLAHADFIEQSYAHQPQATLAANYVRAQALWKLGQQKKAYNLMQHIYKLQPKYRLCGLMLSRWRPEKCEA